MGVMNVCTIFVSKLQIMVEIFQLKQKREYEHFQEASSSWDHDYLYKMPWQRIQYRQEIKKRRVNGEVKYIKSKQRRVGFFFKQRLKGWGEKDLEQISEKRGVTEKETT